MIRKMMLLALGSAVMAMTGCATEHHYDDALGYRHDAHPKGSYHYQKPSLQRSNDVKASGYGERRYTHNR